jgi:hypothetical protein
VLAGLDEEILEVERNRAIAPPVIVERRVDYVIAEVGLKADSALLNCCAEVWDECLCIGVAAEYRREDRPHGKQLDYQRRSPRSVTRFRPRGVAGCTRARDHQQLIDHDSWRSAYGPASGER